MIVTPQYDQTSETYTVDWPGRPEGPVPTFTNYPQARAFADRVERGEVPGFTLTPATLTPRPQPQPEQPKSDFPPLHVSGLGTQARGLFRELRELRYPKGSQYVFVNVPDEIRRKLEPEYPDLRERPRSPLV